MEKNNTLWDKYIGNSRTIVFLKEISQKNKLSQVYLFEGPEGVGKHTAALFLAASVICQGQACGQCLSCLQILKGISTSVFDIAPEGNFITIEQIREIQHELSLKSAGESDRFVIIDGADHLKLEAANALLKTIEEPPHKTIIILLTSRPDVVLPTIISRTQRVFFRSTDPGDVGQALFDSGEYSKEEAFLAAEISGGLYGRAYLYLQNEWKKKKRTFLIDTLLHIQEIDSLELAERAEQVVTLINKPVEEMKKKKKREVDAFFDEIGGGDKAFRKRIELKMKRQQTKLSSQGQEEVAQIIFSTYRDILLLKNKKKTMNIINQDYLNDLQSKANHLEDFQTIRAMEAVNQAREIFLTNANVQLGIEALLFRLKQIEAQKINEFSSQKF